MSYIDVTQVCFILIHDLNNNLMHHTIYRNRKSALKMSIGLSFSLSESSRLFFFGLYPLSYHTLQNAGSSPLVCWFLFVQTLLITNNKKKKGGFQKVKRAGTRNICFFTWPKDHSPARLS